MLPLAAVIFATGMLTGAVAMAFAVTIARRDCRNPTLPDRNNPSTQAASE